VALVVGRYCLHRPPLCCSPLHLISATLYVHQHLKHALLVNHGHEVGLRGIPVLGGENGEAMRPPPCWRTPHVEHVARFTSGAVSLSLDHVYKVFESLLTEQSRTLAAIPSHHPAPVRSTPALTSMPSYTVSLNPQAIDIPTPQHEHS
jgi:hypothetical protein